MGVPGGTGEMLGGAAVAQPWFLPTERRPYGQDTTSARAGRCRALTNKVPRVRPRSGRGESTRVRWSQGRGQSHGEPSQCGEREKQREPGVGGPPAPALRRAGPTTPLTHTPAASQLTAAATAAVDSVL